MIGRGHQLQKQISMVKKEIHRQSKHVRQSEKLRAKQQSIGKAGIFKWISLVQTSIFAKRARMAEASIDSQMGIQTTLHIWMVLPVSIAADFSCW